MLLSHSAVEDAAKREFVNLTCVQSSLVVVVGPPPRLCGIVVATQLREKLPSLTMLGYAWRIKAKKMD